MKKKIFKKLYSEIFVFFLITLFTLSSIVWILQAVNFLDIVSEDGHSIATYFKYSSLNLAKIISKTFLLSFFLSLFYVFVVYEEKNQLIIYWSNSVTKINFLNKIILFSTSLVIVSLVLSFQIVPYTQDKARSYIRSSNLDFFPSLIKPRKFIDTVENLTVFIDKKQNQTLTSMQKVKANLNGDVQIISLNDIWNTDAFIHRMQQISDAFNLDLVLNADAVNLHKVFLSKRANHNTWNRVYAVIEAIKNKEKMDCSDLDLVEQGYLSSWIEKNYDFIQTPLTRNFFSDTDEILEYVKYYPNHYKAMNPNLPKFNNIDNPFHLWAKNKKL